MELTEIEIDDNEENLTYLAALMDEIISSKVIETVVANLNRYDEVRDDEKEGIYKVFGILENILEIKPESSAAIGTKTYIMNWIVGKLSKNTEKMDDNKLYGSEILSILLQAKENQEHFGHANLLPNLLEVMDTYKKKSKFFMDEKEMILNILDSLSLALMIDHNKAQFIMNEGIDIMLECLKKKEFFSKNCYTCIDFSLINNSEGCRFFIGSGGLKL